MATSRAGDRLGGISSRTANAASSSSSSSNTTTTANNIASNRTRPLPMRRAAPSTSSSAVRSRAAPQLSGTPTSADTAMSASDLINSIPRPSFPPPEAFDHIALDLSLLHLRLLQIAQSFLHLRDGNKETASCDLQSASLYALLALQVEPTSVPARRLYATTLLHGAQAFPFGPSTSHSSALSLTPSATTPPSSASIAGANAAIEVLQDGSQEVFLDVGCARLFAKACSILGRRREGKDALAWTLKQTALTRRRSGSASSNSSSGERHSKPLTTILSNFEAGERNQAIVQTELGSPAARANRYDEARAHFLKAKRLDRWSWTAWAGLCEVGCDENVSSMFRSEPVRPASFYMSALERQLLGQGLDKDLVSKAMEELRAKGDEWLSAAEGQSIAAKEEEGSGQKVGGVATATLTRSSTAGAGTTGRPGSRIQATSAAIAGTKRVRTATSGSSIGVPASRSAPAQSVNGAATGRRGATSTTDAHASKRPALSTTKTKGPVSSSQIGVAPKSKVGGTLAAVRTNEQQRPASSASGSSRGTYDKEIIKPRRSARMNVAVIDDQPAADSQMGATQKISSQVPPTQSVRLGGRTAPQPSAAIQADSVAPASRKAVQMRGNTGEGNSSRGMTYVMQTAAFEAARDAALWTAVDCEIRRLLHTLGMAYFAVKNDHAKSALILLRRKKDLTLVERNELKRELGRDLPMESFTGLEEYFRNTIDVQCLIARAYHSQARYQMAEKHFSHARRLSPTLSAHMDIFSLTLFHLQREVTLTRLTHELSLVDANSCFSHIAKGNTFALQREHSLALQCFQRACLAAPDCAYAFTLAGYEALELGFRDRSVRYFRQAINTERRHWNAFAGLGQVFLESERLDLAAFYYKQALGLNRTNPVLWDVYGGVLCSQGKLEAAEEAFERAIELDMSLATSHIKMAEVLLLQGQTQAEKRDRAHLHLLEAVKYAPEEAHVHLMLAHTYMEKGKGEFARIDQGGKKRRVTGTHATSYQILLPSELQQLSANGSSGPSSTARAVGNPTIPTDFQAKIAQHLCAAIDLDPRYVRYIKAMGEGAKAALRGIVGRFMMDGKMGIGEGSSLLVDSSAILEPTMDSLVDMDGDQVLEDPTNTEELDSEGEEGPEDADENDEEVMEEEGEGEEAEEEEDGILDDRQSDEGDLDISTEDTADLENDAAARSSAAREANRIAVPFPPESSDVSMSF